MHAVVSEVHADIDLCRPSGSQFNLGSGSSFLWAHDDCDFWPLRLSSPSQLINLPSGVWSQHSNICVPVLGLEEGQINVSLSLFLISSLVYFKEPYDLILLLEWLLMIDTIFLKHYLLEKSSAEVLLKPENDSVPLWCIWPFLCWTAFLIKRKGILYNYDVVYSLWWGTEEPGISWALHLLSFHPYLHWSLCIAFKCKSNNNVSSPHSALIMSI